MEKLTWASEIKSIPFGTADIVTTTGGGPDEDGVPAWTHRLS